MESSFLREAWSNQMAPASAGVIDRIIWLMPMIRPLTVDPGGAGLVWLFWSAVGCGVLGARPKLIGVLMAGVIASAAALGVMRVSPLFGRFVLWAVPAAYVCIAFALDAGVRWMRGPHPSSARAAGAVVALPRALVATTS